MSLTPDQTTVIDLRDIPEEHLAVLRREAIAQGISLSAVATNLVREASARLVAHSIHHLPTAQKIIKGASSARLAGEPNYLPPRDRHLADPDGRAARAAGRDFQGEDVAQD